MVANGFPHRNVFNDRDIIGNVSESKAKSLRYAMIIPWKALWLLQRICRGYPVNVEKQVRIGISTIRSGIATRTVEDIVRLI